MDANEYDDEKVLTSYVWNNFQHLLTRFEKLSASAAMAEEKAGATSSAAMAGMVITRWGAQNDPEVAASLKQGVDLFRKRVKERLLQEHTHEIFINRCPKCDRVVRTPRAKQCLWCGHDWHDKV